MSDNMDRVLAELKETYAKTPDVPCDNCGRCCVSPHLSYIEFMMLLRKMVEVFSEDELRLMISSKPVISEFHMSNIVCPLLHDNTCSCYDARPISCRLEGANVLDTLTHRERICQYQSGAVSEDDFGGVEIEEILEEANNLNAPFCGTMEEPYYFDSVNLHCWFAVMFDKDITQDYFLETRKLIFSEIDLSYLADSYVNHTKLNEKLDLIDEFFKLNEEQKAEEALACILKVNEDFPYTGAYYFPQSNVYVNFMRDLVAAIDKKED